MAQPLDINHASTYELERAFHSREQAQLIMNKRELLGDFKSWEDVQDSVPGLSDRRVQALRDNGVTVGAAPPVDEQPHSAKRKANRHEGTR